MIRKSVGALAPNRNYFKPAAGYDDLSSNTVACPWTNRRITLRVCGLVGQFLERLRDPSHVCALTLEELVGLAESIGLKNPRCVFYAYEGELETL